jgi:hypothetical protein
MNLNPTDRTDDIDPRPAQGHVWGRHVSWRGRCSGVAPASPDPIDSTNDVGLGAA